MRVEDADGIFPGRGAEAMHRFPARAFRAGGAAVRAPGFFLRLASCPWPEVARSSSHGGNHYKRSAENGTPHDLRHALDGRGRFDRRAAKFHYDHFPTAFAITCFKLLMHREKLSHHPLVDLPGRQEILLGYALLVGMRDVNIPGTQQERFAPSGRRPARRWCRRPLGFEAIEGIEIDAGMQRISLA